jgi:phage gpG-like protein
MGREFVSYSVDNDMKFRKAVAAARDAVKDLTIPLTLIAKDFFKSERAIFQLSGPGLYPDLSTKPFFAFWEQGELRREYPGGYKEYKQAKAGFVYPILKLSGALERSLTDPTDSNAVNFIVNKNTLIVGTRLQYAIYHQSDAPRTKIPLRKMLFVGPEAPRWAVGDQVGRLERWLGILNGFLEQKMTFGEFKKFKEALA